MLSLSETNGNENLIRMNFGDHGKFRVIRLNISNLGKM